MEIPLVDLAIQHREIADDVRRGFDEVFAGTINGRGALEEQKKIGVKKRLAFFTVDDPKTILLGFGDFTPGSSGGVAQSNDFGKTWSLLPLPVEPNSTIWTFGVNAAAPEVIFAASRYGYLYRSDNGGTSWSKLRRELSEIAAVCLLPN